MDTLKKLRPRETIEMYDEPVNDKTEIPYLIIALKEKQTRSIIVVTNHSDEMIDVVLDEIDPVESGHLFFESELEADPVNNCMVPNHRLATAEELDNLKFRGIRKASLPVIKMTDPIRRWHNFPAGSIVAVEREEGPYYRRVK